MYALKSKLRSYTEFSNTQEFCWIKTQQELWAAASKLWSQNPVQGSDQHQNKF